MRRSLVVSTGVLLLLGLSMPLWAQAAGDADDLKTTVEALKQRVKEQDQRIKELETKPAGDHLSQVQREETSKIVQDMLADAAKRPALPAWAENLKFYGDFRLRFSSANYNWGVAKNTEEKKSVNLARFRLRFGVIKTWLDDQMEVGFRLASGNSSDPTSTNQTLGDTGSPGSTTDSGYAKRPVWIDLAYAKWSPKALPGFSITGGKMKNPMLLNDIFFDTDVNPEGFWVNYETSTLNPVTLFGGAGYFLLRDSAGFDVTSMYGGQVGAKYAFNKDTRYTLAGWIQDYSHYGQSVNKADGNDSPLSTVPNFHVFGLNNSFDWKMFNLPWNIFGDWAHNCGEEDKGANSAANFRKGRDYRDANNAYALGIKVGQNKKKGDWSARYRYAYVEADSLPGNYVDSDFGFANRKGSVLTGEYNITDDLSAGVSLFFTDPIFSPTTTSGSNAGEDLTTTLFVDMVWKF